MKEAQRLPAVVNAGGEERILSLTDRIWLKVKSVRHRGAATRVRGDGSDGVATWWLGAAGYRAEGHQTDFYPTLKSRSTAKAKGSHGTDISAEWMMPTARDDKRARLETALAEEHAIHHRVRSMLAESLRTGKVLSAIYAHHTLEVLVKAPDGETYVAIGTNGMGNPRVFAVLLDSVPGADPQSWQPEPDSVFGITPRPGQVIFSAMVDPRALAELLDEYPAGTVVVEE